MTTGKLPDADGTL